MRDIAIIGLGNGMNDAPKDMERWGLPWSGDSSYDIYFEMHADHVRPYTEAYKKRMRELEVPIFMQKALPDVRNTLTLPEDAAGCVGGYIESSIGYMLAYAAYIADEVDRVSIFGVGAPFDAHYIYQRANLEYLIGMLIGLGVQVNIHPDSELMSSFWNAGMYGFDQDNLRPGTEYVQ